LGSERAAAGDVAGSLTHLRRAWDKLADDPERLDYGYFPSLCSRLVKALNANGLFDEANATGEAILKLLPGFTDIVLEQAMGHRARGNADAAIVLLERCLEMGDAPAKYSATVGAGTFHARVILADILVRMGDLGTAETHLHHVLVEHA